MNDVDIDLADNTERHRFELRVGGEVAAFSEYNAVKGALLFTHTETLPAHQGKGLAGRLIGFALGEVRRRGLQALPACPFVAAYIRKHPEYQLPPGPQKNARHAAGRRTSMAGIVTKDRSRLQDDATAEPAPSG